MGKSIFIFFIVIFFSSCGGGGGSSSSNLIENPTTTADKTVLLNDEFSNLQWHRTQMNLDTLNQTYLGYNNGDPIIVQVVDSGIDAYHEDLYYNMNFLSSYNVETNTNDPSAFSNDTHGTLVAGVIGAIGYNDIGIKGIAPSSNLAGFAFEIDSNGYFTYSIDDLELAWLSGDNATNIAISNNSWGSCVSKDLDEEAILKTGTEGGIYETVSYDALRDGKGRIYLFAGGNGRLGDSDCPNTSNLSSSNTSYLNNSQYTIAVSAVGSDNFYAYYSSPGSNILVSGYSSDNIGIVTTSVEGEGDFDDNYTNIFGGTSASTPMVSGAIALVLEACPNLSYRDIKYLIAKNSTRVDTNNSSWIQNSAGLWHSNDYGYGLINPSAMIAECSSSYTLLGQKQTSSAINSSDSTLLNTTVTKTLNINNDITVEWVGLTITSNYSYPGDLEINITSPLGTTSQLLHGDNHLANDTLFTDGFRLSSQAFIGESSEGTWSVEITAVSSNGSGSLQNLSLEVVGH